MTTPAPAASALVISPEYLMPPSAMTGMLASRVARKASAIAVICGTPAQITAIAEAFRATPDASIPVIASGTKSFGNRRDLRHAGAGNHAEGADETETYSHL